MIYYNSILKSPFNPTACRWNDQSGHNMIHSQTVQPELQLNMNSQGGFVPQFINHTNRSETVPSPIQSDSSSIQVPFIPSVTLTLVTLLSSISQTAVTKMFEQFSLQLF